LHGTGIRRIGVFYADDAFGKSGLEAVQSALQELGTQTVAVVAYDKSSAASIEKAAHTLAAADIGAVVMIAVGDPVFTFLKHFRDLTRSIQVISISVVNYALVVEKIGAEKARGIGFSQSFPYPFSDSNPLVREYRKQLQKYAPGSKPTYFSLEGYINAYTLVEAMRRAQRPLTAASVRKSLAALDSLEMGDFFLKFDPVTHNGSSYVDLTIIGRDGRLLH
jgi:ABC-type branched-subunit amino acid transport system substrate-binding protein